MFLRRQGWWFALVFLAYFGIAIVVTWPLVIELGRSLPGSSTDSYVHYWNGWWVREALWTGQSPYYSHHIFYPHGVSLVLHNLAWMSIAPWLVLQLFLPGIVAYNLVLLLNLALCGFAAFLLVRYLSANNAAAFTAGLIYLTWPFRTAHLDHPNLISTYWLPITMLFLIKWQRGGRLRYALAAGVALALVGFTRWQMLIPAAFVIAVYLAATIGAWWRSHRTWAGFALAAGVAMLLLAPAAALLAGEWQTTITSSSDLLREGEEAVMQTDSLAYVTPGSDHPLWGEALQPVYDRIYAERSGSRRFSAYLGVTTLILAGIGLWRRRKESVPWLIIALILIALAMGSVLRINGKLYPEIPTLYRLLEPLYVVRLIRVPDRFNITLALPVAVIAAFGMVTLLSRFKARQRLTVALLCGLILFEYLAVPIPRLEARIAPIYNQLAEISAPSVLLNLPMDQQQAKRYMFAQTSHGRPIVQGKVARIPPGSYAYLESHPWLVTLHQHNEMAPWLTAVSDHLAALVADNIDYLILHKDHADADRLLHWRRYLIMDPLHEDEQLVIYTTRPEGGVHYTLLDEMAPGIGPVRTLASSSCVRAGDVLGADVAWGTTARSDGAFVAGLLLIDGAGQVVGQSGQPTPLPVLADDSLLWTYLTLGTPSTVTPGAYELALVLRPAEGGGEGEIYRIGSVEVRDEACRHPDLPPGATAVDARFSHEMRLLGYEVQQEQGRLRLTLYWRLMQHMDANYKVFVHVFEPGTGIPVAQDDMMPHRGGYPTRFWAAGETVVDHIPVALESTAGAIAPGSYGIAVGVYNSETLERLTLVDGNGDLVEDGRLVLQNETVQIGLGQ